MERIFEEIDIRKELPPNTSEEFIVFFQGDSNFTDSGVGECTGKDLNKMNKGMIKSWLKPTTLRELLIKNKII